MKPFQFQRASAAWPTGQTLLHVYVTVDLTASPALAALVGGARAVLRGWPLTMVEDRWLHVTIEQITDLPGARYTAADRQELAQALATRLASTPPFEVMVGSLVSYHSEVAA